MKVLFKLLWILLIAGILEACNASGRLEYALECAATNKGELEKVLEYYKDEPVDFSIYTADESIDAVLEFIKEEKIDLLAVVSRNKGFFEKLFSPSFTKKILSQNAIPLFVFHE